MPSLLIITKKYPPVICGVGDHSLRIRSYLEQQGWKVWVLAKEGEDSYRVEFWELDTLVFKVKAICKRNNIQLVLWQYVPYSFSNIGLPVSLPFKMLSIRLSGIKQVIFYHEVSIRMVHRNPLHAAISLFQKTIAFSMNSITDLCITSTKWYANLLWPFKPIIIPISDNISANFSEMPVRSCYETGPYKVFCFSNRVTPTIIQAFNNLQKDSPGMFKLITAGKRDIPFILNSLWHEEYGIVPAHVIVELMQCCHMMVQPGTISGMRQEGISTRNGTVATAMAQGIPLICNEGYLTNKEIFIHGYNVWFCSSQPESFTKSIQHLAANPSLMNQISKNARKTFEQFLSWQVVTKQLGLVLDNTLKD